jgi:hypothetical protein
MIYYIIYIYIYMNYIINSIIIYIAYKIEQEHKRKNEKVPLHTLVQELFTLYIIYSIYQKLSNYKIIGLLAFMLHLFRFIIYIKEIINIPLKYQLLGIIGIISLNYKSTLIIDPIIRVNIIKKIFNINGFNPIIDIPITTILILYKIFYKNAFDFNSLERNFIDSDIIYHILEILLYKNQ